MDLPTSAAGPVGERERIAELDVLRGVALFGVLLMNFVFFAGPNLIATETQLSALPSAKADEIAYFATRWLVGDKANTMFATLFGLGFYLQMKRGEGKPGFEKRYSRRLFWLLVFGWLNSIFLWMLDILNLYALAGFALLTMRRWRTRSLLIFGCAAAFYSDKLQEVWTTSLGLKLIPDSLYGEEAILERQAAALSGDYPRIVASMWHFTWTEWLAGGLMVAWFVYALGRFALGACIGRSGMLENVPKYLPLLKRVTLSALPLGLLFSLGAILMADGRWDPFGMGKGAESLGAILRSPAALLLAAGYSAGVVVAFHTLAGGRLLAPFAQVGRMALTNYLAQGLIYALILFKVGPGLGLAGRIGSSSVWLICIAFFAFQMAYSHWWLARYRFGPMEWLWRTLTYGERPAMRRAELAPAAI